MVSAASILTLKPGNTYTFSIEVAARDTDESTTGYSAEQNFYLYLLSSNNFEDFDHHADEGEPLARSTAGILAFTYVDTLDHSEIIGKFKRFSVSYTATASDDGKELYLGVSGWRDPIVAKHGNAQGYWDSAELTVSGSQD